MSHYPCSLLLETVPEIHIVSPDNKPIVESSGYIEEYTSQNNDATLTSDLTDVTDEGRIFTDKANDFSLEIPEGAITEGERLTVDVGVAWPSLACSSSQKV